MLIEAGPLNATLMNTVKDQLIDANVFAEWLNDYAWDSQFFSPDDHARADYQLTLGMGVSQPRFHESTVDPHPIWRLGAVAATCVQNTGMTGGGDRIRVALAHSRSCVLFVSKQLRTPRVRPA